ncbi:MAG: hypothetical protein P8Z49_02100 [Acidobacteriota bacterium]
MKSKILILIIVLVVIVAGAGGLYWYTHEGKPYSGLAAHFPEKTSVFAETSRVGQWMSLPESAKKGNSQVSASAVGNDPLLQVVGQVWAKEKVNPKDLPSALQNQPLAVGAWETDKKWQGVGLMRLLPGQKAMLTSYLEDKVGKGEVVATSGGMQLHKVSPPGMDRPIFWGVSDSYAVMASGEAAARETLSPGKSTLANDKDFLDAVRKIPSNRGAYVFIKGSVLSKAVQEGREKAEKAEKAAEAAKAAKAAKAPGSGDSQPAPGSDQGEKEAIQALHDIPAGVAVQAVKQFASLKSLRDIVLWTAPPESGKLAWQARAWVSYTGKPSGLWQLLAQGSSMRPTLMDRIPKDGKVYLWVGGMEPAKAYKLLMEEASKSLPVQDMGTIRAVIGAGEGKFNMSFSNDLLPTLGQQAVAVLEKRTDSTDGLHKGVAVYWSLQDTRRFESLVSDKLAPQLHLKPVSYPGARGWSIALGSKGHEPVILVSGGLAIITNNPKWALSTSGESGKAYQQLADFSHSASGVFVASPDACKDNRVPIVVSWRFKSDGIAARAELPGKPLNLKMPAKGK